MVRHEVSRDMTPSSEWVCQNVPLDRQVFDVQLLWRAAIQTLRPISDAEANMAGLCMCSPLPLARGPGGTHRKAQFVGATLRSCLYRDWMLCTAIAPHYGLEAKACSQLCEVMD